MLRLAFPREVKASDKTVVFDLYVPGMAIPVWFKATETGTFDLVCAELCGWGHYKMKGRLTVESRTDHDAWLDKMFADQEATK